MSGPSFTKFNLCSIYTVDEQEEYTDAAHGLPGADSDPLAGHRTCDPANAVTGGVLHAFGYPIRQLSTGGARLAAGHSGRRTGAGR